MMTRPRSNPLTELIFGCLFTLLGTSFAFFALEPTLQALQMRSWQEVPCVIEHFEISDHPDSKPAFRPEVSFRYKWQGKTFTGTQLWPGHVGEGDYESLAELRTRLGPEFPRSATCRINPDHPDQGALVPAPVSGSPVVMVGFLGFFIASGISIARAGWCRLRGGSAPGPDRFTKLGGFAGFFVMGGFFVWGSVNSLRVDCSNWVPTPATMIWSRLETIRSKGTSYRANVFYRYRFGGHEYGSSAFGVSSMNNTSSKDSAEAFVKAHPSDVSFTCFVNPQAPWQSVVDRDHSSQALISLMVGLMICCVGLGGLCWGWRMPTKPALTIKRIIPKQTN